MAPSETAAGPPPHPLLGNLPAFREDPLGFLKHAVDVYGDVVRVWMGPWEAHLIRHPHHLRWVLRTNQHNYVKRAPALRRMNRVLGQGLVTSEGELWRRQRQLIQPAFHPERLNAIGAAVERVVHNTVCRWRQAADAGEVIDIHSEMMRLSLLAVAASFFGRDLSGCAQSIRSAVRVVQEQTAQRLFTALPLPLWLPTHRNRELHAACATLNGIVDQLIEECTQSRDAQHAGVPFPALTERADRGARLQMRDEIVTLLLAGHENTGNALTWMWILLTRHPESLHRVREELDIVLDGAVPGWGDIDRLPYARQVVEETLRLYPTSWLLLRRALADDVIGGFRIPRRSYVVLSPFLTHRHPDYWPEPDRFRPERFAEDRTARDGLTYLPFGAGNRKCIGAAFALREMQLVLVALAREFRLTRCTDHAPEPGPAVSLPPRGPVLMRVTSAQ